MRLIRMEIQIVRQRRLLWELVKRDLRSRYVGSIMGLFWSVINPLIMLIIYIFIFSLIFQMGGHPGRDASAAGPAVAAKTGVPNFPVYLCCGLLPWNAILESLLAATAIVAGSGGLIKKAVFPMAILPMQAIVSAFINLGITMLLFGVFLVVTGAFPGWAFLMIVPLAVLQFILIVGPCYFFATVNVFFRDTAPILSAVMNFLFWTTPIVYPAHLVTERLASFKYLYLANPVTHLIRLYRQFLYVDRTPETFEMSCSATTSLLYLLCIAAVTYVVGKYVFTRSQPHFVDEV
jgi:ABC-type polysaccharide/polyol phosphate export permease